VLAPRLYSLHCKNWPPHFSQRRGLAFLLFLTVLGWAGCTPETPKRFTEAEKRQIALRIKEVIEQTGGTNVWVKGGIPPHTSATIEVLALPSNFDSIARAIAQRAGAENLKAKITESQSAGHGRRAEIQLYSQKEVIGQWRLQQVPHLVRAAIVIDDLGQSLEAARKLLQLPSPIGWAILPNQRHSAEIAAMAHDAGREVLLHLPMQPEPGSSVGPGEGAINIGMGRDQVAHVLAADLNSVPYAIGVNNHMGSSATADARLMSTVMAALAQRHLFFVDSRTTSATVALDAARRQGLPTFYRSVFLDDVETVPASLGQLRKLCGEVENAGAGLAIGHPYPTTLEALAQFLPQLDKKDVQLVPVSQLLRLPEVARLAPPRRVAP
jgi:uncharacterized protein